MIAKKKSRSGNIPSKDQPTFAIKTELARYVDPDELRKGCVSSGAFLPNPGDKYLSVNSLEIETLVEIAEYFRSTFQNGVGGVAAACRKIADYNNAANFSGLSITKDSSTGKWTFDGPKGKTEAYRYRWTHLSSSHCGVEFIRDDSDYLNMKKIARRLAGKRPHLFTFT